MLNIGFTGTQTGVTDQQMVALAKMMSKAREFGVACVRHGDCIGADAAFHLISLDLGLPVEILPCNISSKRAYCSGARHVEEPKSPLVRNKDIVNASDIVIACPREETGEELRSGTWSTVRYARKIGKRFVVIRPSGRIET